MPPAVTAVSAKVTVTEEVQNYSLVVCVKNAKGCRRARRRRLQPFVEVFVWWD